MTVFADILSSVFERRTRFTGGSPQDDRSLKELSQALVGTDGERSGQEMARRVLDIYVGLGDDEKIAFFRFLADEMNISPHQVRATLAAYEKAPSGESYKAFMMAAEPQRQELIRRLNKVAGATEVLVRMRADLLRLGGQDPSLQALDIDVRHLLSSWFNRGFLVLRPISWESPAHILEKIIAYEAVHAIDSWDDLRLRLHPEDRRCFSFFHPAMPDEPLIFVEVALSRGVPASVQTLLAEDRMVLMPEDADTAVFYSISNCQPGLAGISFGTSLIKQVVRDLAAELPGIGTFVTLSPIPGLSRWLTDEGIAFDAEDAQQIRQLAADYLLNVKRDDGLPRDPVARFHLGNGALVHAVHSGADTSPKGRAQSEGAMVNYLYDLTRLADRQEAFVKRKPIAAAAEVKSLAPSHSRAEPQG